MCAEGSGEHAKEVVVAEESFKYLPVRAAYLSAVDFVKELEEDKCIENIGQMPSLILAQVVGLLLCLRGLTW